MTGRSKKPKKKRFASGVSEHNLLTFGRVRGLPSDDSDDSDYEPEDELENTSLKKRKRGTKVSSSQPATKKSKKMQKDQPKHIFTSLDWSSKIPNELLYKIFLYAVYNFSSVPLLCRVSRVCQKWHAVASDPFLWCSIDLSYLAINSVKAKDETLALMSKRNIFKYVQELNLNSWSKLTNSGLEIIANHCVALQSINLSKCGRITSKGVSLIATHCSKLTSINLSYIQTDATSNMSIKNLLHERGHGLEALYLAGNKSVGTPSLAAVQACCVKLKILDLSSCSTGNFSLHLERLQAACPHLVELRLSELPFTVVASEMDALEGFPCLELLSLASLTGGFGIDDKLLQRFLKTSSKLRQLDLRGCENVSYGAFTDIPADSLEQLFLSRCKISWKNLFKIIKARWNDSLRDLDVSWCSNLNDAALLTLMGSTHSSLMKFNLAGTGVATTGVRNILDSCPKLTELNLTSCRGVPRGLKKLHDVKSIRKLRAQPHTAMEQVEVDTLQ